MDSHILWGRLVIFARTTGHVNTAENYGNGFNQYPLPYRQIYTDRVIETVRGDELLEGERISVRVVSPKFIDSV